MRICIIRNAEARTNAGIMRIIDVLIDGGYDACILSRNRYVNNVEQRIIKKTITYKENILTNYEIQLPAETGRGLRNLFQLVIYQFIVLKWLISNRKKYDVIHAFDLDAGFPSLFCNLIIRKPVVYHIADFYADSRSGIPNLIKYIIRRLEYFVISRAEATIICTEERAQQIKGSRPKKLLVIHNSPSEKYDMNDDVGLDVLSLNKRPLILCYVGGLEERRFIKSAINVVSKNKDYKLQLAGMGTLEEFVEQSSKKTTNIEYYGRIDYSTALKMYSNCDIMFAIYDPKVPNHRYSAPNKVYEAMMLGKPIIVAKETGVDKLVEREKIGICIDYTEEDFQKVLDYIRAHPEDIREMGERAKKAFEFYSWDKMKKRALNLYREIQRNMEIG
jgi:glycosyltransferase involved in cell wall biosynthesis